MWFAFLFVASSANASVQGTWAVDAKVTVKVTIKGHSATRSANSTDEFTFSSNGDFATTDMTGTWSEKNKNFTVLFDSADVQTFFESALADAGIDAGVTVTQCTLTGTEGKSTIRGTMALKANIFLTDYGLHGTISATANFAGSRTAVGGGESAGSEVGESLKAAIREQVAKSLSSLEK
jgi:hypothetical protein